MARMHLERVLLKLWTRLRGSYRQQSQAASGTPPSLRVGIQKEGCM
jgi:hypothetical protein